MSKQEEQSMEEKKPNNTAKIIAIIGGVGLIVAISAFSFGAHTGIYFDRTGVHLQPRDRRSMEREFNETITAVEVVSSNNEVRVERGDKISFRADYYQVAPEYSVEDGVLKIKFNDNDWSNVRWNLGFQIHRSEILTVTVPVGILGRVNIENDNGSIKAEAITADEVALRNDNGSIWARSIVADKLTIENDNGRIEIDGATTATAIVDNNNGSIRVNNLSGKLTVDNSNGSIEVVGVDEDAYLWLKNSNGSIRTNGNRQTDRPFTRGAADAANSVRATNGNGSIRVDTK